LPYSDLEPGPGRRWPPAPHLAQWEAAVIDGWWHDAGRPDPYTVVEVGAGVGERARDLLGLGPECLTALRLVLVERGQQAAHRRLLPIDSPAFLFPAGRTATGDDGDHNDDDDYDYDDDGESGPPPATGIGPLITSLDELPQVEGPAGIIAVGWLSRLPSDRFEYREGRWWEVRLAAGPTDEDGLVEMLVPAPAMPNGDGPKLDAGFALSAPAREGDRLALLTGAASWLAGALRTAGAGMLAAADSWTSVTEPVPAGQVPPVSYDQLASVRRPVEHTPAEPFTEPSGLSVVSWRLG
jgi:hypothetical protein